VRGLIDARQTISSKKIKVPFSERVVYFGHDRPQCAVAFMAIEDTDRIEDVSEHATLS
jgi:hypothetical protein